MALDKYWTFERQFQRDRGPKGPDPFGMPKAVAIGRRLSGEVHEFEIDVDVHDLPEDVVPDQIVGPSLSDAMAGKAAMPASRRPQVWGIQYLCPRCEAPCYVPSRLHPTPKTEPREIIIHWDKLVKCSDGLERPTVTVSGKPLVCDYLTTEITGILQAKDGVGHRCGWVGIIEEGKMYDHSTVKGAVRAQGQ